MVALINIIRNDNLGCFAEEKAERSVRAYNDAIEAELERRHGKNFWKRFRKELEQIKASRTNLHHPSND